MLTLQIRPLATPLRQDHRRHLHLVLHPHRDPLLRRLVPPLLSLLVRPSQKPAVLRLHKPRYNHPRLQRLNRHHDHGHPAASPHPRQTLPLQENHPLRRLLPRHLRHPLLRPLKVLLHL